MKKFNDPWKKLAKLSKTLQRGTPNPSGTIESGRVGVGSQNLPGSELLSEIRQLMQRAQSRPTGPVESKVLAEIEKLVTGQSLAGQRAKWWPPALTAEEYEKQYGLPMKQVPAPAGPVEPPSSEGLAILQGPTPLPHSGALRLYGGGGRRLKQRPPSQHWAMYGWLVEVNGEKHLGISFLDGFRCWYPGFGEPEYNAIVNSESGSYWCWDHGAHKGGGATYFEF